MEKEIQLGDEVRCKITGFKGTVVERTEYINGCVQFGVLPKCGKDVSKMPDAISLDKQSLQIVKKKSKKIKSDDDGGAMKPSKRMRGF